MVDDWAVDRVPDGSVFAQRYLPYRTRTLVCLENRLAHPVVASWMTYGVAQGYLLRRFPAPVRRAQLGEISWPLISLRIRAMRLASMDPQDARSQGQANDRQRSP